MTSLIKAVTPPDFRKEAVTSEEFTARSASCITARTHAKSTQALTQTLEGPPPMLERSIEVCTHVGASCAKDMMLNTSKGPLFPHEHLSLKGVEGYFKLFYQPKEFDSVPVDSVPEPLKSHLCLDSDRLFKERITWDDPRQEVIAAPTDEGLIVLCAHYNTKYGVPIVVAGDAFSFKNAISKPTFLTDETSFWGVIATHGDIRFPHVTPYLCHKDSSGIIHIYEMDSSDNQLVHIKYLIIQLKEQAQPFRYYQVNSVRQADFYSCRTDAVVVLKDALRDIQLRTLKDLHDYLDVQVPTEETLTSDGTFTLPGSWSKTVQKTTTVFKTAASSATKDPLMEPVLSKKAINLGAFFDLHQEVMTKNEVYSVLSRTDTGSIITKEISFSQKKVVHTYLNTKGKRLLEKTRRILLEPTFEQMMLHDLIKQLYKKPPA